MNRSRMIAPLMAVILVATAACASGGDRGQAHLTQRVGSAYLPQFADQVPRILRQHGYSVYRETATSDALRIETEWREREPVEAERQAGYNRTQVRVLVHGRPVRGGGAVTATGDLFNIDIRVEGRGQREGDWNPMGVGVPLREFVRPVINDLRMALGTGVRKF